MKVLLSELRESRRPIRPVLEDTEFLELRDSMDSLGQLVPVLVANGEIVDGHRRFRAAKTLNWHEICTKEFENADPKAILAAQIVLNDNLTIAERRSGIFRLSEEFGVDKLINISHTLNRHPDWVADAIGISELTNPVRVAVDKGYLDVQSAYLLAKFKPTNQKTLFGETLGLTPSDRVEQLRKEVRHLYERKLDRRSSKNASPTTPSLRSERSIVKELFNPSEAMRILTKNNAKTPRDGWNLALKWALKIDPGSLEDRNHTLESLNE